MVVALMCATGAYYTNADRSPYFGQGAGGAFSGRLSLVADWTIKAQDQGQGWRELWLIKKSTMIRNWRD